MSGFQRMFKDHMWSLTKMFGQFCSSNSRKFFVGSDLGPPSVTWSDV